MASEPTRDIEALLAPISEAAPAGVDLRADTAPSSPYFQLKDARSAARAAERRMDSEGGEDALLPEWQTLLASAPPVLKDKSKDLEIAVWYLEALARADGFAGLRDGFQLLRGLVERYWETMFSLQDEEGMATRLAPLAGLNGVEAEGALIQPLRKIHITAPGDDGPFSAYHYEQAWALSQVTDAASRERREGRGAVTLDRFTKAVAASGAPFYIALLADIEASITEFDALSAALSERAGADAPPSSSIRELLRNIQEVVANVSKDMVARHTQAAADAAAGDPAAAADTPGEAAPGGAAPGGAAGAVRGREDALQRLLQLANYFRMTEPHSPMATTLEEAVRRARLPFSELLAELVPDVASWRAALTTAGIKPPAQDT